jgi:hypothetical protein
MLLLFTALFRIAKFRHLKLAVLPAFIMLFLGLFAGLSAPAIVSADANDTISFQAQLEQSNGEAVANGNYNVEFKLYSSSSGGSPLWTEDYLNSNTEGADVTNGYLTAQLGSITAFPSNIDWSQNLWVTMNIGGTGSSASWDGEMNPRMPLTAVPYAFQANQLEQESSAGSSNLNWSPQTSSNSLLLPDESGTLCVDNDSEGCGFAPGTSNSYVQNGTSPQTGVDFDIGGNGTIGGNLYLNGSSGSSIIGGTGGLSLTVPGGNLNLSTTTSGNITVASAGDILLSAASNSSITLGSTTSSASIVLNNSAVNIGNVSQSPNTVNIDAGNSSYSDTINIGAGQNSSANGKVINIGTGAPTGSGATQVTIGTTGGASTSTILGSLVSLQTSDYVVTLNNSGIGIGNSSVNATADLTFGNGGTRTINTLQSGSGNGTNLDVDAGQAATTGGTGGNLVLQAGAGTGGGSSGSVIAKANGTDSSSSPTFAVQAADTTNLLAAYTGNSIVKIGNGTPTLIGTGQGDLYVTGSGEFGVQLRIGNGTTGLNFIAGVAPSSTNPLYTGNSQPVETVNEIPSFNGMTTSNNANGTLTTGFDNSTVANTNTQNFRNYYNWTTTNAAPQTETLYVQIPVPRNFSSLTQGDQICYNVYSDDTTSGKSAITSTFYDTTNTAQSTYTATPTTANTWQQECTTDIGGTITVNGSSYMTVEINLTANTNQNVRIGSFTFDYLTAF